MKPAAVLVQVPALPGRPLSVCHGPLGAQTPDRSGWSEVAPWPARHQPPRPFFSLSGHIVVLIMAAEDGKLELNEETHVPNASLRRKPDPPVLANTLLECSHCRGLILSLIRKRLLRMTLRVVCALSVEQSRGAGGAHCSPPRRRKKEKVVGAVKIALKEPRD